MNDSQVPVPPPGAVVAADALEMHSDPADRFIVATAIEYEASLVAGDAALRDAAGMNRSRSASGSRASVPPAFTRGRPGLSRVDDVHSLPLADNPFGVLGNLTCAHIVLDIRRRNK